MRVRNGTYYTEDKYDRPEVVQRIVKWCSYTERAALNDHKRAVYLYAKRIKSLCLKHYSLASGSSIRFCKKWEDDPSRMLIWLMEQDPTGQSKIIRYARDADFGPNAIDLKRME